MEIKANRIRALIYYSPLFAVLIVFSIFSFYLRAIDNLDCEKLFGLPVSYIALVVTVYGFPITFFIISIWAASIGYKILKHKANPPAGKPVFFDTRVTYSLKDKISGFGLLLAYPLLGAYVLYLGNTVYIEIINGRTISEIYLETRNECI